MLQIRLRRLLDHLTTVCETVAAACLAVVILLNAWAVFARYVLHDPVGWSEEAMRYGIVWLTFLTIGPALFRNEHMAVETVDIVRHAGLKLWIVRISLISTAIFAITIIWFSIPLLKRNWHNVTPVMEIRFFWAYVSVAVGCGLLVVYSLAMLLLGRQPYRQRDE